MRASPLKKPLKLVAFAALSLLVVSCSTKSRADAKVRRHRYSFPAGAGHQPRA